MDPFTAAFGPLLTAVAGAVLAWVLIRGKEAARKTQPAGPAPDTRRERLYRRSFETSPVGLAVLTPQGQWVRINDRMRALLGYTRDELSRLTIRELTHSDDRKVEASHIRKLMRREISSYSLEKRLLCKDRSYRRFEVSMVRFEDESAVQDLWQCVVSPVNSTIAHEAVEQRNNLGQILEPIGDLAYLAFDDQGIINDWNEGATRIFGYGRDEMIGRSRTSLYKDTDVWSQKPLKDLREAVAHGRLEYEDTRVGRDGMEIRLKITIFPDVREERVTGFIELAREIEQVRGVDQYRQAYERLKEISEEKMHSLQSEVGELRQEIDELHETKESLQSELRRARSDAETQMGELRILTDAFRKELENRRSLEHELREALQERDELGHRVIEMERHAPLHEREFVDLATPSEAHWIPIEHGRPSEILRELASDERTGTLIVALHSVEKRIHFDHGRIYSSTSNDPTMFLGEFLRREGLISSEEHERALEIHNETGIALGRILVLNGTLEQDALAGAIEARTIREVSDFLEWTEGQMMFLEGEEGSHQLVPVSLQVESLLRERALPAASADELALPEDLTVDPDETQPVSAPASTEAAVELGEETVAVQASSEGADERPSHAAEETGSSTESAEQAQPVRFVASRSKRSTKFHTVDCLSAKKIESSRRVEFRTEADARSQGFKPCRKCIG